MGDIKVNKKRLKTTVEGTRPVGDARLTVKGRKGLLSIGYEVLVETPGEKPLKINGSYMKVRMYMERDERAKEGVGLLEEVAGKILDPKRSLTENFDKKQLSCLGVLMGGEGVLEDIVHSTDLETSQVSKAVMDLQATGLVCRCEKKGELPRRYTLTETGKQITELLRREEDFLKIKRGLKRRKGNGSQHKIFLNENELLCLVLLDKGPKTTKEIAEITGQKQEETVKNMKTLESWGIAERGERLSDKNWKWTITATGEHHIEVLMEDEKFQEARERLKQETTDPTRRFSKYFKEGELLCLAVLVKGPKTVKEIAEATGLEESDVFNKLNVLSSGGMLTQEGKGEDCKYTIDERGQNYIEWLLKEEKFQEIQKKVKPD